MPVEVERTTRRGDLPAPVARRPRDSAAAVLRAVLDHGPIARSTVARASQLSAASVTGLVAALLDRGLIREAPEAAGPPGAGRPHVPLDIEPERVGVIGVHIAVPRTTVAVLDLRGRVLCQRQDPIVDRDPTRVLAGIAARIDELRGSAGRRILGAGLATGGWVDATTGTIVDHHLLGWHEVPAGAALAEATGLPVRVDSNSRALLRAEQLFGEAAFRVRESAVHLFVGNVVDVAFSAGGVIHQGPRSAAGVIAHLPVEGCTSFQAAVSEQTLVRRALAAGLIDRPHFRPLLGLALGGHPEAVALFEERARLVGRAAATLLDLFDPEVLIVAEAGVNRMPGCLATLRAEVAARSSAAHVVRRTSFPPTILALAGGGVALDRVYAAPLG
jgi:predicted NBD/HSP70 family sugar kinase